MISIKHLSSLSNYGVFHVESWLFGICDEELGSIGIRMTTVGHGYYATPIVLYCDLINEIKTVLYTFSVSQNSSSNFFPQILLPPFPVPKQQSHDDHMTK